VIAIIFVLSSISIFSYRSGQKEFALQRATYKLAQDIRRTQEMAMATMKCPQGTNCAGQIPVGYGVFLDISGGGNPTSYTIYADTDGDSYFTGIDAIIATSTFEQGIIISNIETVPNPKRIAINFEPPDPKVKLKFDPGAGSEVNNVTITLSVDSLTKSIFVNKAGLIEIQ
jgi:hypothetical protein